MIAKARHIAVLAVALSLPMQAQAIVPATLQDCMKQAEALPDIAAANAELWGKNGGGQDAALCHAHADFRRGEFEAAGDQFAKLAADDSLLDKKKILALHIEAGQAYSRAQKAKQAEREFSMALAVEPENPDILYDRAIARAADQRYWDAVADVGKALQIKPENPLALRLRGQIWVKMGNNAMAEQDFLAAERLDPSPVPVDKK